jgi:hypothetical protein
MTASAFDTWRVMVGLFPKMLLIFGHRDRPYLPFAALGRSSG